MKKKGLIYMVVNTTNNKAYIGKTVHALNWRITRHYYNALTKDSQTAFHRAIRKYGKDAFQWDILEDNIPYELLSSAEMFYIALFKRNGTILYNLTAGGEGSMGYKHSEVAKLKMSQAGRRNKGRKHSEEHKANIGKAHKGKPKSEEHRIKNGKGHAKTYVLLSPDGVLTTIINMTQFCKDNGLHASHMIEVAKGKATMHRGWTKPRHNTEVNDNDKTICRESNSI